MITYHTQSKLKMSDKKLRGKLTNIRKLNNVFPNNLWAIEKN